MVVESPWSTLWKTIQKTMENHHAINGKIHYKWPFSIAFCMFTKGYLWQKYGYFPAFSILWHPAAPAAKKKGWLNCWSSASALPNQEPGIPGHPDFSFFPIAQLSAPDLYQMLSDVIRCYHMLSYVTMHKFGSTSLNPSQRPSLGLH